MWWRGISCVVGAGFQVQDVIYPLSSASWTSRTKGPDPWTSCKYLWIFRDVMNAGIYICTTFSFGAVFTVWIYWESLRSSWLWLLALTGMAFPVLRSWCLWHLEHHTDRHRVSLGFCVGWRFISLLASFFWWESADYLLSDSWNIPWYSLRSFLLRCLDGLLHTLFQGLAM